MSRDLLSDFKGNLRTPLPLHPLETALIWVVALNVCSLPWMLGGMRPWAQFVSLGLSFIAIGLAIIPRSYSGDLTRGGEYRMVPSSKLLRWPLFWLGLLFFGYVLTQALNPAWEYVQMENSWGMRQIENIAWLPTGMRTPFEMMNPWRQMMIWGSPFLTLCALWIGFNRRKSVVILLTAITINATVLAVLGIAARYTAPDTILWLAKGIPNYSFSSFIYKNHAGSFFALAVGISLALAVWHHKQATRHLRRSSPAGLYVFMALILLVAVLLTYSRAAILIMGGFLLIVAAIGGIRVITNSSARQAPLVIAIFCVGFVSFASIGLQLVNSEKTLDRIRALTDETHLDRSVVMRQIAWNAGLEMSSEKPNLGWGAGGFRFLFPRYQITRPEITYHIHPNGVKQYAFWEHAHNDYLQLLIETGRAGTGILAVGTLTAIIGFFRRGGRHNLPAIALGSASLITLAHAATDFPLQNPAILSSWATIVLLALLLVNLDDKRTRQ